MANSSVGIALILSAVDRASSVINRVTTNAVNKMKSIQDSTSKFADKSFANGRQLITNGTVLAAPIVYATKKAMDFESAMADVAKVLNVQTGSAEFIKIGEQAKETAIHLARSSTEAAKMYANLAQGGVIKQELSEVSNIAGEAGVAFGIASDIAGDRFVKMKNAMNMTVAETKKSFDAINYLSDKSAAEASQILDFMAAGGAGVARTLSMSSQHMNAFGTVLIEQGKGPEETATIFERLQKGIYKSAEAFNTYKNAGKGTEGLLAVLNKGMIIKDEVKRNEYFRKIGGEYSTDIMQLGRSMDKLKDYIALVSNEQNYLNSVQGEFNNRSNTSAFKFAQARIKFEQMAITIGSQVLPHLNHFLEKLSPIIDKVAKWVSNNKPLVFTILKVVGGLAALSIATGSISFLFGGVSRTLSVVTGGFKTSGNMIRWLTDNKKGLGNVIFTVRYRLLQMSQFMSGKLLPIMSTVGRVISSGFVKAFTMIARVIGIVTRVLMANPIILIITGIALVVYLIYKHWDSIKSYFKKLWAATKQILKSAWDGIKNLFLNYTPHGLIIKHWDKITAFFSGLWDRVKGIFIGYVNWVFNLGSTFFNAGSNIVKSIWNGIKSMAHKPIEAIKTIVKGIRDHLPFSPAKVGPLRDIHRIKLVETIASSIKPNAMVSAMRNTLGNFANASYALPASSTGGTIVHFNYNPTINLSGGASPNDAATIAKIGMREFEKLMQQYLKQKGRVSFNS